MQSLLQMAPFAMKEAFEQEDRRLSMQRANMEARISIFCHICTPDKEERVAVARLKVLKFC
jgi:hypothetical protein